MNTKTIERPVVSLAAIGLSKPLPPRIIMAGDEGVGKTKWASDAPNPIFIQTEDGLGGLQVNCFPLAKSFDEVMGALDALLSEDHEFRTVVVDSLDWLEPLVWAKVCEQHNISSIEKLNYGKGYIEADLIWQQFINKLNQLREVKRMAIVLISHTIVTRIEDPSLPAYDKTVLKLHKRSRAIMQEYADAILFAKIKTETITENAGGFGGARTRAISTGERVMYTSPQPQFVAKNRYNLPAELPLSWSAFQEAFAASLSK